MLLPNKVKKTNAIGYFMNTSCKNKLIFSVASEAGGYNKSGKNMFML